MVWVIQSGVYQLAPCVARNASGGRNGEGFSWGGGWGGQRVVQLFLLLLLRSHINLPKRSHSVDFLGGFIGIDNLCPDCTFPPLCLDTAVAPN